MSWSVFVERTFTVRRPVAEVFDYLGDFEHTEQWDPGTVTTRRTSGDGGLGTTYDNESEFLGRRVSLVYETITFRRSLQLWQRFTVESRLMGHDERSVYLMHRAVVGGEVYAEMIVRARFLRRSGGIVPHEELFSALHRPDELPPLPDWVTQWAASSALPSTRQKAPSIWPS